jgi:lipopolysaccharide heptosyltransferase I
LKALLVRLSSIGDVVHTLPTLAALGRAGWEAGWIVEPVSRPLLEGQPLLAELVTAPPRRAWSARAALAGARALRASRYDVALDLAGLWKSAAWARLSGASRVLGYAGPWRREPLSRLLLGETGTLPEDAVHVIDKNLALLRPLGIDALGLREFPLPASAEAEDRVARALAARGVGSFAILNPGGGWSNKLWPPESYGSLAAGLKARGIPSLVTWGPGEEALADRVVVASDGAAARAFATSLPELVALARRCRLFVGADTGPLHLACAVGAPVVGLYGPTDPARNGPFSREDVVVRRRPPCAPCHRRRCPSHDGVMTSLSPAEVLLAAETRLGSGERGSRGAL